MFLQAIDRCNSISFRRSDGSWTTSSCSGPLPTNTRTDCNRSLEHCRSSTYLHQCKKVNGAWGPKNQNLGSFIGGGGISLELDSESNDSCTIEEFFWDSRNSIRIVPNFPKLARSRCSIFSWDYLSGTTQQSDRCYDCLLDAVANSEILGSYTNPGKCEVLLGGCFGTRNRGSIGAMRMSSHLHVKTTQRCRAELLPIPERGFGDAGQLLRNSKTATITV